MNIDKCICKNTEFKDLKIYKDKNKLTLDEVMRITECGLKCGMCRPYIKAMFDTGKISFNEYIK